MPSKTNSRKSKRRKPPSKEAVERNRLNARKRQRRKNRKGTRSPVIERAKGKPGRKPGIPNRITTLVKDAILMGGTLAGQFLDRKNKEHAGLVRYIRWLAIEEPSAYATLLGKVLPLQINARVDGEMVHKTRAELASLLHNKGLPMRVFDLPPEEFRELKEKAIEHITQSESEDEEEPA